MSRSVKQEVGICRAYQRWGSCERGNNCKFAHQQHSERGNRKSSGGGGDMMINESGELSTPRGPTSDQKVRRNILFCFTFLD